MFGFLFRMVGRVFYLVFVLLGGFVFVILKWVLVGTRGSRERRKLQRTLEAARPAGGSATYERLMARREEILSKPTVK